MINTFRPFTILLSLSPLFSYFLIFLLNAKVRSFTIDDSLTALTGSYLAGGHHLQFKAPQYEHLTFQHLQPFKQFNHLAI